MEYRNPLDDTLREVTFLLSSGEPSCQNRLSIDSLLFLAVPIGGDSLTFENGTLKVTLYHPLAPKEKGSFLIAFRTTLPPPFSPPGSFYRRGHLPFSLTFTHWFPRLAAYRPGSGDFSSVEGEPGMFYVALAIDSSYSVAHPGKILNEKELYGLLPQQGKSDTVYVDIVNHSMPLFGKEKYHPTFPDGMKRYYLKGEVATDFPFTVGRTFLRDRAYLLGRKGSYLPSQQQDSLKTSLFPLTIEVCYPPQRKHIWQESIAKSAMLLVKKYQEKLGWFSRAHLTIVAGEKSPPPSDFSGYLVLPLWTTDSAVLNMLLAYELARQWFPPSMADKDGEICPWREGMAWYLAGNVFRGYEEDRGKRERAEIECGGYFLREKDKENWHTVARLLHVLRFLVGEDSFWQILRDYRNQNPSRPAPPNHFLSLIEALSSTDIRKTIEQLMGAPKGVLDFAVSHLEIKNTGTKTFVSYRLKNNGVVTLPLEVGYVTVSEDTLYDTLSLAEVPPPGKETVVEETFAFPLSLKLLILDPHHFLCDSHRSDNYLSAAPARKRYYPGKEGSFPCGGKIKSDRSSPRTRR